MKLCIRTDRIQRLSFEPSVSSGGPLPAPLRSAALGFCII